LDMTMTVLILTVGVLSHAGASESKMSQSKLMVVGSTMMDNFAYVERVPGPGETIVGQRTALGFGGKGANQAAMAAILGTEVSMVACLGDDTYGAMYRERFAELGVDATHVHTAEGCSSGVAPIWVEGNGMNRIIIIPGANHMLTASQAVLAVEEVQPAVVIGQFEIPQSVTAAAFEAAKQRGATTLLNPAPAQSIEPALLAVSDWIIPNESEFYLLSTGVPSDESPTDDAIMAFARKLGIRLAVTLGSRGVALVSADGDSVLRLPPPSTAKVVDTTGAGDAFVGAFAHALATGLGEVEAVTLGMACASDSVTRQGTQTSFPDAQRCQALIAALRESVSQ